MARRSCSDHILLCSDFERLKLTDDFWCATYKPYASSIPAKLFHRMKPVPKLTEQCIYACAKLPQRHIDRLPRNLLNEVMKYAAMPLGVLCQKSVNPVNPTLRKDVNYVPRGECTI